MRCAIRDWHAVRRFFAEHRLSDLAKERQHHRRLSPLATSSPTVSPTSTTKPLPAIDLLATPQGWVPVAYGDVQISVPATWWVLYNRLACESGSKVGTVFINPSGGYCGIKGIPKTETTVVLKTAPRYKNPAKYGQRQVHNRILVYELYSFAPAAIPGTYLIPSLGVEIEVEGPLAKRVIDTLSRSPRTVALATGPAPSVPRSWLSVTFAGLKFSVPATWSINRTQVTPTLGGSLCLAQGQTFLSTAVTLSTDTRPLIAPPNCFMVVPIPDPPTNAVQVDSGSSWKPIAMLSFSTRCLSLHGLTACPATSPAYSILVLKVRVPGHPKTVYVSIGLAGSGMIARTILYSLKAA